jgi:hypothetical protein
MYFQAWLSLHDLPQGEQSWVYSPNVGRATLRKDYTQTALTPKKKQKNGLEMKKIQK